MTLIHQLDIVRTQSPFLKSGPRFSTYQSESSRQVERRHQICSQSVFMEGFYVGVTLFVAQFYRFSPLKINQFSKIIKEKFSTESWLQNPKFLVSLRRGVGHDESDSWIKVLFCETPAGLVLLQWRHNGRDGVSNHSLTMSKKTSKLLVTGLCEGNSPLTGEFPTQRASNAKKVSIWWRHHVLLKVYVMATLKQKLRLIEEIFFSGAHNPGAASDKISSTWHFCFSVFWLNLPGLLCHQV